MKLVLPNDTGSPSPKIFLVMGKLALLLLLCFCCQSRALHPTHRFQEHGAELIELPTDGREAGGLVWVVQLSDLHFSSYRPRRALSFKKLLPPLLALINPSLVLITGDLTDGKSKNKATMRQDESEWEQYKDTIDWVISKSKLPEYTFFDIRGNHDKFGVPEIGGRFDYFSNYSITAQQNRSSPVQSIILSNGEWKHLFVGIDMSMEVGLRGPCNLFGHASIHGLNALDKELSQCDNNHQDKVTKLVFGHFTTSFIASTEDGKRPEDIFAKHNIMAYLCGHLHFQFGRNLLKHHVRSLSKGIGEFWEWEMGDWKESLVMRILAIDHGHASFLDLDVIDMEESSAHDNSKGFILITYPLDSRKMQRQVSTPNTIVEDSVRALVFSQLPVVSAKALVYDSHWDSGTPVEELTLEQMFADHNSVWYFVALMNFSNYLDASPARFSLKIIATDSSGKQIASDLRPFSANGYLRKLKWTWKEFFVMGIVWDAVYPLLLWTAFCILASILMVPKLFIYLVIKKGLNLGLPLCKKSSATWSLLSEALVEGHKASRTLWWMQLFILVYLVYMPWFWGRVLGESYPLGSMSVRGWSLSTTGFLDSKWGLGVPDVMTIVLPFLYHILLPLFVHVFALFAEQAVVQIHVRRGSNRSSEKRSMGLKKPAELDFSCRLCKRWVRKALLVACLGVAYLHAERTWAIVGAYGMEATLISPGFAWPVPILLVAAVLQTSRVGSSCHNPNLHSK